MSRNLGAKAARVRSRSAGNGSSAFPAGKPLSLPGSEYCSDPVFRVACRACETLEGLESGRSPDRVSSSATLATPTTWMTRLLERFSPSSHTSHHHHQDQDDELSIDDVVDQDDHCHHDHHHEIPIEILIEDPDLRPYIWDC